jgi:hypothetical protein
LPIGCVVVVKLLERAEIRIAVVDELFKCGITDTTNGFPVSSWEMAHGPPSVHVLAVASGNGGGRGEQRGEYEMLHGGGDLGDDQSKTTSSSHSTNSEIIYKSRKTEGRLKGEPWSRSKTLLPYWL